jgi:hypothetical protein
VTEIEERLRQCQKECVHMSGLLSKADALIAKNNEIIGRIRVEFGLLLIVSAVAGFALGICVTRLWWSL